MRSISGWIIVVLIFVMIVGVFAIIDDNKLEKEKQVMTGPVYSLSQDSSDFVLGYKVGKDGINVIFFNKMEETGKKILQKILVSENNYSRKNKVQILYSDTARLERTTKGWKLYVPKNTQFKKVIELGGEIIISD